MSDAETPAVEAEEEGGAVAVMTEAVVTEEAVGIEPLVIGPSPTLDWRAWVAQQGGSLPTATQVPPYPPATTGTTPNTAFPGINPVTGTISGANSTPVYADTPTTIKPGDLYQGYTAQMSATVMVVQPFPPPSVLITKVTPNTGVHTGGTVVVLTGSGFTGATGVNFGTIAGTAFTVNNDRQITVTTATGMPTGANVNVTVLSPSGNGVLLNGFYSS